MRLFSIASLAFVFALSAGCQTKGGHEEADHQKAKADTTNTKVDTAKADTAAKSNTGAKSDCGCGKSESECAQAKAEGAKPAPCEGEKKTADVAEDDHSSHPIAAGEGAVNPHGPLDEKLGAALAGAEKVDVATLVQDPAKFDGKTVTLEGEVTDMCFHKRGWFALASEDGKKMVRVITAPGGFQVPNGAVGSTAKTEGAIKVVTLNEKQIEYFRRSHKFISDEEVRKGGPIKQAILMASGAEFKR